MNHNRVSYRRYPYSGRGMAEAAVYTDLNDVNKLFTELKDKINKNGHATLEDYYKLIGATVLPDDSKWGWDNLLESSIVLTRRGYEVNMPATVCVKRDVMHEVYDMLQNSGEEDAYDTIIEARHRLSEAL